MLAGGIFYNFFVFARTGTVEPSHSFKQNSIQEKDRKTLLFPEQYTSGANAIKKIYSLLRNSLFRSLDSYIGVRSKNWEPLFTPNAGLLNF